MNSQHSKKRGVKCRQRANLCVERLESRRLLDASAPAILQWFESSYDTIEDRVPDLFMAGYGSVWTPPPSRSDTSDFSVGYDVYDRFDLGSPGKPTLYGTETGLTTLVDTLHTAGIDSHVDLVINHNGFSDLATEGFYDAGGYPGLSITLPNDIDGDFHSAYWGGPEYERLAGLIDIAHEKNHQFIRNPVDSSDSQNIRPGTTPAFGRLANVPEEGNRRFYADVGHNTIYLYDPKTGEENISVHQFNLADPMAGDPSVENAMGYLMRNAQWLVQVIGVDGLRIDAAKHLQGFTLDYLDRAVYRSNPRMLLDGSPKHVFTYSEVYDADPAVLHPHVKKDIDPNDLGRIGGNRDTLDFKLYFSLKENLEYGTQPSWDNWNSNRGAWYRIKDAALDISPANGQGDFYHNGNAGVTFVESHDVKKPYQLGNVAQAYTLMLPGNTVVYFNGKEFGDHREFPKPGRSDALSVAGGSDLTRILNARNTHGRGNYLERWVDDQGLFAFERESSAVVLLSNRTDGGFDSRTLSHVGFAPGTYLVELTGNAESFSRDPLNDIPEVVQVFDDNGVNKVNVRFARNTNAKGDWTGAGYLIYGLPTPQAPNGLELIGVDSILPGESSGSDDYDNGRQRQTDLHVVKADQLGIRLQTVPVNLLGSIRDRWADGDSALLKLDQGRPINDLNPHNTPSGVDFDEPGSVAYGFEQFEQKSSPLIGAGGIDDSQTRGDGEFLQQIDITQLEEGPHFLEARAFRHRTDNGPGVYSNFKKVIYVDRLPPSSTVDRFEPWDANVRENRDLVVRSIDKTANNVHVFLNLPAAMNDAQIMSMVEQGQGKAEKYDRDLFKYGFFNVVHGNNVATTVTLEPTGNFNIKRNPGLFTSTIVGAGLGDVNTDGVYSTADIDEFSEILKSDNERFHPAADINGDGLVDLNDLRLLGNRLDDVSAIDEVRDAYNQLVQDATLQLSFSPDSIRESDGGSASLLTVTRDLSFENGELVVRLTNSDPSEVAVVGTVILPANASQVEVAIDAVDDQILDGLQTVAVTADGGPEFFVGRGTLDVADHETLSVAIRENSVKENSGPGAAQLIITRNNTDLGRAVVVDLGSSDSSELTVAAATTIPAGVATMNVVLDAVDDRLLDGLQVASITVSSSGYDSASDTLEIEDHELLFLEFSPAVIDEEPDGVSTTTVKLTRENIDLGSALTVALSTDPAEISIPAAATIPSGASSVEFSAEVVRDGIIDGNQLVQILAVAAGYENGVNDLLVLDDPFPWYNTSMPHDVNDDGFITPIDVFLVVEFLSGAGAGGQPPPSPAPPYYDVNNSASISPIDALLVIDLLQNGGGGEGERLENELGRDSLLLPPNSLKYSVPIREEWDSRRVCRPFSSSIDQLRDDLFKLEEYWLAYSWDALIDDVSRFRYDWEGQVQAKGDGYDRRHF